MTDKPPQLRPFEIQRAQRLAELEVWGKKALHDCLLTDQAHSKIRDRALEQYGVSLTTALNYATIVLARMRRSVAPR